MGLSRLVTMCVCLQTVSLLHRNGVSANTNVQDPAHGCQVTYGVAYVVLHSL